MNPDGGRWRIPGRLRTFVRVRSSREAGTSILEVTISFFILVVGIMGVLGFIYQVGVAKSVGSEQFMAHNAARNVLEKMRSARLEEVYALHNLDPSDDPGLSGSAPGREFDVPGLTPLAGQRVGRILFPEGGNPPGLREDVRDPAFDMAQGKDLNRDGVIDGLSHSSDYRILPVRILLEWKTPKGAASLEMYALLTQK